MLTDSLSPPRLLAMSSRYDYSTRKRFRGCISYPPSNAMAPLGKRRCRITLFVLTPTRPGASGKWLDPRLRALGAMDNILVSRLLHIGTQLQPV